MKHNLNDNDKILSYFKNTEKNMCKIKKAFPPWLLALLAAHPIHTSQYSHPAERSIIFNITIYITKVTYLL